MITLGPLQDVRALPPLPTHVVVQRFLTTRYIKNMPLPIAAQSKNPPEKVPKYCFERPIEFGIKPPPRAPISPIRLMAIALVAVQRSGTSWKVEPLPAPRQQNIKINNTTIIH